MQHTQINADTKLQPATVLSMQKYKNTNCTKIQKYFFRPQSIKIEEKKNTKKYRYLKTADTKLHTMVSRSANASLVCTNFHSKLPILEFSPHPFSYLMCGEPFEDM